MLKLLLHLLLLQSRGPVERNVQLLLMILMILRMSLSLGMIYTIIFINPNIVSSDKISHLSPTRDSPKKARAKEPSTPLEPSESVHQRQKIFDAAVYVSLLLVNCPT